MIVIGLAIAVLALFVFSLTSSLFDRRSGS